MWVFPNISFNMTTLMTEATQSCSARNINSQKEAKRKARLRHWSTSRFPKPHIPVAHFLPGRRLLLPWD